MPALVAVAGDVAAGVAVEEAVAHGLRWDMLAAAAVGHRAAARDRKCRGLRLRAPTRT
jgi:hypothetical protein